MSSASLIAHCEPLFQTVCRLNRIGRLQRGSSIDYAQTRAELEEQFEVLARIARGDITLGEQYRKVELALLCFVDHMIAASALPFASKWDNNRLAAARNEHAGDERFFTLLDETLADKSPAADERLAIFYICIGLGFTGGNPPEFLRKKMQELAPRVKAHVDADESAFITPASYQHTDLTNLPMPMAASLVPLLIVLTGLLFVVLAVNIIAFRSASAELNQSLDAIIAHDPAKTNR